MIGVFDSVQQTSNPRTEIVSFLVLCYHRPEGHPDRSITGELLLIRVGGEFLISNGNHGQVECCVDRPA